MFPTASSLQRVMTCHASGLLPQVKTSGEASIRGSAIHLYLARVMGGWSYADAIKDVPEQFVDDCASIELDDLPKLKRITVERPIAISANTGRAREPISKHDRDYSDVRDGEFAGTADIVGLVDGGPNDGMLYVGDYKTGNGFTVPRAKNNWQLKMLGLAFARYMGIDRVMISIIKTQDEITHDEHILEAADLNKIELELFGLAAQLNKKSMSMVEGDHCKYCPSFTFCPAKTALIKQVTMKPELTVDGVITELQSGDAATAYARYRVIKQIVHKLDSAFRSYAEVNPIALPDGMVYGPVSRTEEILNATAVYDVLSETFSQEVAREACTFDTSKAAIDRAIAPHCARGTKAAKVREVLKAASEIAGVEVKTRTEIREHKGDS